MSDSSDRVRDGSRLNFIAGEPAAWTGGLYLSCNCITAVLEPPSDDVGTGLDSLSWKMKDTRVSTVVHAVAAIARLMRDEVPEAENLELAVAVAGHVDASGRVVKSSSNLRDDRQNWTDVELATLIERATGSRTHVVNDANALAVQDLRSAGAATGGDFVSVLVNDYGVGAGIVANGQLVIGNGGSAGELGHVRVSGSRTPCRCGGIGCLERFASIGAITAAIENLSDEDPDGSWVVDVLHSAGQSLGAALVTLVNLLNPGLIVIHGPDELVAIEADQTESVFINAVKDVVCSRSAFSDAGLRCRVVGQPFSAEYLASGAAQFARQLCAA